MRVGLLLLTSLTFINMSGCDFQLDDTNAGLESDGFQPGIELGTVCGGVPTCSITNDLCQSSVLRITACIRDDELPELPSIRVITRAELREELADKAKDADKPSRTSIARSRTPGSAGGTRMSTPISKSRRAPRTIG